ncbi:MAG: T9SS type A sorting domain-containing protein [bacterium]
MFVIIICFLITQSPQIKWGRIYGGEDEDYLKAVLECADKGFIAVGSTNSYGNGDYDVYVLKVDSLGFPEWSKAYGGTDDDYGYAFCQTIDNGYIIAGATDSYGQGGKDIFLIKMNENGDSVWTKVYGDSLDETGYSIIPAGNNSYVICGATNSMGAGGLDILVMKIDSIGEVIWSKTYGGIFDDCGFCINATYDKGFIITGATYSFSNGESDVYVIKIDSLGNEEWSATYGSNDDEKGFCVQQTSDSGYVVCGTAYSVLLGYEWCLLRYNERGTLVWHTFQGSLNDDFAYSVQEIGEKNYIIGGNFSYELYVVRADTSGLNVWMLIYGGPGTDCAYSVKKTQDHGYIIAGMTNSYGAGDNNAYLVRTYPDQVGIREFYSKNIFLSTDLRIYPSPFKNKLNIFYKYSKNSLSIKIYDVSGRLVRQFDHLTLQPLNHIVWDGTDRDGNEVSAGMYIMCIEECSERLVRVVVKY